MTRRQADALDGHRNGRPSPGVLGTLGYVPFRVAGTYFGGDTIYDECGSRHEAMTAPERGRPIEGESGPGPGNGTTYRVDYRRRGRMREGWMPRDARTPTWGEPLEVLCLCERGFSIVPHAEMLAGRTGPCYRKACQKRAEEGGPTVARGARPGSHSEPDR